MKVESSIITYQILAKAQSYNAYRTMINNLLAKNLTTGSNHSEAMINYTKMNVQRMKRLDKTTKLSPELVIALQKLTDKWTWLILTEAWCGDAAQNIPIISHCASVSDNIDLRFILRDEHPNIMDAHLTNGGKAIPKLICLKTTALTELGTWGPRPAPLQQMVIEHKENPVKSQQEFFKQAQLWYIKDNAQTIQQELLSCIQEWSVKSKKLK